VPSAIILAGGQSTRMGEDKASLALHGRPLLQHVLDRVSALVDQVVIVTRPWQLLPRLDVTDPVSGRGRPVIVVEDAMPGTGPAGGLYTGLSVATSFPALAVACDMPLLQQPLLLELLRIVPGFSAVVPRHFGVAEPLCAAYSSTCLPAIRTRIGRRDYRMSNWLEDVHTFYLDEDVWQRFDPEGLSFFNLNTPEDLAKAQALLSEG
jgi:molybdopterin-guanine dinucleotide biosynthesis protein A